MKVYGSVGSTATQRVLACLHEKELQFEFVPINMAAGEHKKPPFLSLNPFGQVPAFEDGSQTLRAINNYLAHNYADCGSKLIYKEPKKMAMTSVWMEVEAQKFDPAASKLVWEQFFKPRLGEVTDEAVVKEHEAKLSTVLDVYEARLAQLKYLGGDCFTLADMHHLPCLNAVMGTQSKKLFECRPHVRAWCSDILASPAWLKVTSTK